MQSPKFPVLKTDYRSFDADKNFKNKIEERLTLDLKNPPISKSKNNGVKNSMIWYHKFYVTCAFSQPAQYVISGIKEGILDKNDSVLQKRDTYLEVGAGPGQYLQMFAPYFKDVTVVEPSTEMQSEWIGVAEENGWNVQTKLFQDFEAPKGKKYDMIFCGHMMYYIDMNLWPKFLEKIYGLLNEGGVLCILMLGDKGEYYDIYKSFTPDCPNIGDVRRYFEYCGIPVKVEYEELALEANTYEEMYELHAFTIVEGCAVANFNELSPVEMAAVSGRFAQLTLDCEQPDGTYSIPWINGYAIVQKKNKSKL